jgi:hypothetical protein
MKSNNVNGAKFVLTAKNNHRYIGNKNIGKFILQSSYPNYNDKHNF